jgi:hypothetical protein
MTRSPEQAAPTRRDFLKVVGAGSALGAAPWLAACGGGTPAQRPVVNRSLNFDLSNAPAHAEYYLLRWKNRHALQRRASGTGASAVRAAAMVTTATATHTVGSVPLPQDSLQLLMVQGIDPDAEAGTWFMPYMFLHNPDATDPDPSGDPLDYIGYQDMAAALVCMHPEIACFHGPTLDYIQQRYVLNDGNTSNLGDLLYALGPATEQGGGWGTLERVADPSGAWMRDANGLFVYHVQYSPDVQSALATAIAGILSVVKSDPNLGANITGMSPTTANAALQGKIWHVQDGNPAGTAGGAGAQSFAATPLARAMASARRLSATDANAQVTAKDLSTDKGYSVSDVQLAGTPDGRTITFTVRNWYLRYLGLYVRFLDANGNPIALSSLSPDDLSQFPRPALNGTYDAFVDLINQELVILGVPCKTDTQSFSVRIPAQASTCLILAGGIGHANGYPATCKPGAVMTAVLDLALPGLFLVAGAAMGLAGLMEELADPASASLLQDAVTSMILLITDGSLDSAYGHPEVFFNTVVPLGKTLIFGSKALYAKITGAIATGEAEGIAAQLMIGFGTFLAVAAAMGTLAQIAETSVEIGSSPATYVTEVTFTHDVTVTVQHDPRDGAGFPATATQYQLFATCDGSTVRQSPVIAMPATGTAQPLVYTFSSLPDGGTVSFRAVFTAASGALVGTGQCDPIPNVGGAAATVTIREIPVPINAQTVYTHKKKTAFNAGTGVREWLATTTPPTVPQLACGNVPGSLCNVEAMSVALASGAVGFAFQAFAAPADGYTGATSQQHYLVNLSLTDDPSSQLVAFTTGLSTPLTLAYSQQNGMGYFVDNSASPPRIRAFSLGSPTVRPPGVDMQAAVAKLTLTSDALVLHPNGKLYSLNVANSKVEVVLPKDFPVRDGSETQASTYSGPGTREGLLSGPVLAAVDAKGTLYVLEQTSNRIQAFDAGVNPAKVFDGDCYLPLKQRNCRYLDLAVEPTGYFYVLLYDIDANAYLVDVYTQTKQWLFTAPGINAGRIQVDMFRNLYALNYETLRLVATPAAASGLTEPSVSQWIPNVPV